jgi:hypothetical protein
MTRAEHVEWAKGRAIQYVTDGMGSLAMASMLLDLRRHPDTEESARGGLLACLTVNQLDLSSVRTWIEEFK